MILHMTKEIYMRTILTALFMILATQTVAQQSRDAMRECFSEVENIIVAIDKFREAWSSAFDERLDGREVAALIFDIGTNGALELVFSKINETKNFNAETMSAGEQTELLADIQRFLLIRSVTKTRVADLADEMKSTIDPMLIADAKADYVQACIQSIEDGKHFTNWRQYKREADEVGDDVHPKASSVPLSGVEKEAFRNQVLKCWSVNIGSRASKVTITVSMNMQPDGKVVASSMAMVGFEGGNASDANVAFQAARRAVLRCQKDGYDLPKDKYQNWRNMVITFDPNTMRYR